jgi:hypothetical protein
MTRDEAEREAERLSREHPERASYRWFASAQRDLDANNRGGACGKLGAFINQVKAQGAKKIAAADAQALTDQAAAVRQSLGCGG